MRARLLLLAFATMASSCIDPTHNDQVAALGDEAPGEREGPLHRAGQPCRVCHGGLGPGSPEFVMAGTVYDKEGVYGALSGVVVRLTDINKQVHVTSSNEVGNFYVPTTEWTPTFPVFVELDFDGVRKKMKNRIGRDGGCGTCHARPSVAPDTSHTIPVVLREASD